jgi:hypothetical protein
MTFLEYCCERLMGPPTGLSGGRSVWPCPECDDRTAFGTLPHKPEYKDRVMCHRCGFRGDEADLIRFFNPREGWPQRRAKLADWFAAWNAGHVPEPVGNSHRGPGSTEPAHVCIRCKMRDSAYDPREDEFEPEADAAIADLIAYMREEEAPAEHRTTAMIELLKLVELSLRICAKHNLHPVAFAGRCGEVARVREMDAEHLASCTDPDCDYRCCRLRRGWTEEEIQADIERMLREHSERLKARRWNGRAARA